MALTFLAGPAGILPVASEPENPPQHEVYLAWDSATPQLSRQSPQLSRQGSGHRDEFESASVGTRRHSGISSADNCASTVSGWSGTQERQSATSLAGKLVGKVLRPGSRGRRIVKAQKNNLGYRRSLTDQADTFAVEFDIRAEMGAEESRSVLEAIHFLGAPAPPSTRVNTGPQVWLRRQLRGSFLTSLMTGLAICGVVAAPMPLVAEPMCHASQEFRLTATLKGLELAATILYAFISIGQLLTVPGGVVRPQRLLRRIRRLLFARDDMLHTINTPRRSRTGPVVLLGTAYGMSEFALLDLALLVTIPAELAHVGREAAFPPTWDQCLYFLNILKLWRWIVPNTLLKSTQPFTTGVLHLFLSLLLFCHMCASTLAFMCVVEDAQGIEYLFDNGRGRGKLPEGCVDFYITALYFSAYTVTGLGYGDVVPANTTERGICTIVMVVSQMYVAKVFADLNFMISTRDYWRAQRHQRLTQTVAALNSMGAPKVLRERVLAYQDYVWEIQKERRAQESLRDLSGLLKEELQTVVYQRLVLHAPFLQMLSLQALRHIISSLKDAAYLPSDFIVRRGAEGQELYFMRDGRAGIFLTMCAPRWTDQETKVLSTGDYFGEVALLTGQKRSSWVMARTYCICSLLYKQVIDEVMLADPSCIVTLATSMQKALGLQPQTTWEEVAERLDELFSNLEELSQFLRQCADRDHPGNDVTWARYEMLMHQLRVEVADQKLLWIEVDKEERGMASFSAFAHVAYGGRKDKEAAKIHRHRKTEQRQSQDSQRKTASLRTSSSDHALPVVTTTPRTPSAWDKLLPLSRVEAANNAGGGAAAANGTKALQQQIAELGDRVDRRIDELAGQVSRLLTHLQLHSTGKEAPGPTEGRPAPASGSEGPVAELPGCCSGAA